MFCRKYFLKLFSNRNRRASFVSSRPRVIRNLRIFFHILVHNSVVECGVVTTDVMEVFLSDTIRWWKVERALLFEIFDRMEVPLPLPEPLPPKIRYFAPVIVLHAFATYWTSLRTYCSMRSVLRYATFRLYKDLKMLVAERERTIAALENATQYSLLDGLSFVSRHYQQVNNTWNIYWLGNTRLMQWRFYGEDSPQVKRLEKFLTREFDPRFDP